jgi:hypothetical protein
MIPWLVRKKLESQFPTFLALASRAKPEAGLPRTPFRVKKWSDPDEGYNFENLSHSGRVRFSVRRKNAIVGLRPSDFDAIRSPCLRLGMAQTALLMPDPDSLPYQIHG